MIIDNICDLFKYSDLQALNESMALIIWIFIWNILLIIKKKLFYI